MRMYAGRWVAYAYGREGNAADACVTDKVVTNMLNGAYPILNIISDLTQADSFRVRAVEVSQ
jgi:hypothetical protein